MLACAVGAWIVFIFIWNCNSYHVICPPFSAPSPPSAPFPPSPPSSPFSLSPMLPLLPFLLLPFLLIPASPPPCKKPPQPTQPCPGSQGRLRAWSAHGSRMVRAWRRRVACSVVDSWEAYTYLHGCTTVRSRVNRSASDPGSSQPRIWWLSTNTICFLRLLQVRCSNRMRRVAFLTMGQFVDNFLFTKVVRIFFAHGTVAILCTRIPNSRS